MATNRIAEGHVLQDLIAPVGGVTSGTPVIIGGTLCIPVQDADAAATFQGYVDGVFELTKASGTTAAIGAVAYFDSTSGLVEASDSATNRKIGMFSKVAANGSTTCEVRLDAVAFGAGNEDLESKADKVTGTPTDQLANLSATGNLEASGIDKGDVVTMSAASTVANEVLIGDGSAKTASGSTIDSGDLPTMAAAAAGAGNLIQSAGADKTQSDSGVAVANVPTMAAVGGAGNLIQTAAADRAQSDSGIAVADVIAAVAGVVASISVPGGDLSDGGTNSVSVDIDVKNASGDNMTGKHYVDYWYSDTAGGAIATAPDQATTATTGVILEDDTAAAGLGSAITDATGNLVLVIGHNAGALDGKFLNIACAGKTASQEYTFTA